MLAIAKERTKERGICNVSFRAADAQNLPFDNGVFDVVVCRLALHHLMKPLQVLCEMVRVCRAGGTVVVEDIYASEHPERAEYQDRWEILRDLRTSVRLRLANCFSFFVTQGWRRILSLQRTISLLKWSAGWRPQKPHQNAQRKFGVFSKKTVCGT
jgi:ubiquinone/menaquinone biosynthesis C-methylase UbiE